MGWHHGRGGRRGRRQEKMERKVSDTVIIKRLIIYVSIHKFRITAVTLLLIGSTLINLITPQLTRIVIDDILTPAIQIGNLDAEALMWWIILFVGIAFAAYLVNYCRQYLMSYVGQNILFKIRQDLFNHLQALSLRFYVEGETGRIMSIITNDVEELNRFLRWGMISIITDIVSIIGAVFFMFSMNLELTFISLSMIPFMIIVVYLLRVRARNAWRDARESIAGVTSRIQEGISGIRVTQAFTREKVNLQAFDRANVENLQTSLKAQRISALFGVGMRISSIIGTVLILWFSVGQITAGKMTIGTLQAYQRYLMMLIWPLMSLSDFFNMFQAVMAASERIFELLDTPLEVEEAQITSRIDLEEVKNAIEYRNVNFSYKTGVPVLKNINLTININEKVALVGPTGAGKSTIVNLLCRFDDPI